MADFKEKWTELKAWQGAKWLPVVPPFGALVELAGIVAVIQFADWALPNAGIATFEPSPYWLPVLLLSLQYGTVAGLLAATAATVAYVLSDFPEQGVGENLFTYLLRIWALPILWIGVSLVLGQFRLRQIEGKQTLRQTLEQRTAEAQSLAVYAKDLEQRCARLERQMTTRAAPGGTHLLDALDKLTRSATDLTAALDTVRTAAFPGSQMSVFAVTSQGLALVAKSGWPHSATWAEEISAAHPLYRAVVSERRAVSVLITGDENVLAGQGLAACPIFAADGSRAAGMVKIEHAAAGQLTSTTASELSVIARLAAPALTEPRVVVDNRPIRGAVGDPQKASRLTKGWTQQPWSPPSGSGSGEAVVTRADDGPERASQPKRAP